MHLKCMPGLRLMPPIVVGLLHTPAYGRTLLEQLRLSETRSVVDPSEGAPGEGKRTVPVGSLGNEIYRLCFASCGTRNWECNESGAVPQASQEIFPFLVLNGTEWQGRAASLPSEHPIY